MRDRKLDRLLKRRGEEAVPYYSLMSKRVRNILLVSSLYDSFTLEEDGKFNEVLFTEYLNLNLRYAPRIVRVSTGEEALAMLEKEDFDLVISMLNIGPMQCSDLGREIALRKYDVPFTVLAYTGRELEILKDEGHLENIDSAYVWQGDVRLLIAIVKSIEDKLNAAHDAKKAGVKCILLVEDSVRFSSSYLPMLYTELMQQTQSLMTDGVNKMQQLMRMRARPKILHARSYEEAIETYHSFSEHILGIIMDVRFQWKGEEHARAGLSLAGEIHLADPSIPILFQSSEETNREKANQAGAAFVNKNSTTLLAEVRHFMRSYLGFGDFIFRNSDGEEARASDLREMRRALSVISDESLFFHAANNDFSTWLRARTEFELARALKPQKVEDFDSAHQLRHYLISSLNLWMERSRAGQVEDFSRDTFDTFTEFSKIGSGSLGGKGRGLAFINALLNIYRIDEDFPEVDISVPPTAVVATDVFDDFMKGSALGDLVFTGRDAYRDKPSEEWDSKVASEFLKTPFPPDVTGMLRTFLEKVRYPLAVRSSSLLEDSPAYPFAGIYSTYMIPNNHSDMEVRLERLLRAIKLVFASTYFSDSMAYIETTPNRLEEEKMAVVIQQIVGEQHGDAFYPNFAGVAKSHNFYPMEGMSEEDGVVSVALGLGGTVVDGGKCVRFSPDSPRKLYQFSSTDEFLRNSQRDFLALRLENSDEFQLEEPQRDVNLILLDLERAQKDDTLPPVGSVYSPENDMIYDGTFRSGAKLVTMAGVLKGDFFPLAPLLEFLLKIGKSAFSSDIEMEFAVNLRKKNTEEKHHFGFLQIRPMIHSYGYLPEIDDKDLSDALCIAHDVLGFGVIEDIQDIVYVSSSRFDRNRTAEIAGEIEKINRSLRETGSPLLLIGPGRWGSSDRWLGIPVKWNQISAARCIIETPLPDMDVEPSQGTHFFQNITSLGIGYFALKRKGDFIDTEFLEKSPAVSELEFVRHIHISEPLRILTNSRENRGAIRFN